MLVDIEDVKLVVKHDRESAQWELFLTQKRIIRICSQEGMCVNWNNNCIHSVRAIARGHKLSTFEIAYHLDHRLPEAKEKENSDRGLPLSEDSISEASPGWPSGSTLSMPL